MDGSRFDDLAKLVSVGAPRRSVLKGLLGAFVGMGAAGALRSTALAGLTCTVDSDCGTGEICCAAGEGGADGSFCSVEGICISLCKGLGEGEACVADGECCTGICCEGTCQSIECCVADEETNLRCAEGTTCFEGICISLCDGQGEGEACAADGDCCTGICCGGACRDTECCIDDTDPNARCAKGSSCFEGICVVDCDSGGEGEACSEDADCCAGICCEGACHDIECCIADEDPNARCPDGTSCFEGVCDAVDSGGEVPVLEPETDVPTTLPNTGIGDGNGDMNGLLGLGLAAGVAALIAAKKLRQDQEPAGE